MGINEKVIENMDYFCRVKLIEIINNISQEDYDDILDNRDHDEFSNKWMEVYDQVSSIVKNNSINPEYVQIIKRLRERTFKAIFEHTQSSDLAAYLSDDISLLLEAIACNYNHSWLNGLWKKYSEGEIPQGNILLVEGRLDEFI
ncbi:hypothetical protein [Paenibacillus macquariensis]|uniref:Uncharacterized protein n=1 Tax=Paenibacillus macquariensis TaxID=948756 RepID=A0ABY1JVB9_9BACL|nr:hypothetical protein [Paenibacillus macquariensis]MEC0090818.1 hypothetical protein [Paenibacillus macquariensis]OAB34557.1 hypothetical protein PMSM_11890 [Paenibacillus macquariensis subsp. macquariensis]SIQ82968.1 hypothetical protein SAMN05421578_104248 [Paenibacillus macquariensis]